MPRHGSPTWQAAEMGFGTPRAYISGPLQAATDLKAARSFYERLAATCRECDVLPYVPHQETDPELAAGLPPAEVFRRDVTALEASDLVIADIGPASSGVGAEIGLACCRGTPVIAVWRSGVKPSRFVHGLLASHDTSIFIEFVDDDDCCRQLNAILRRRTGTHRVS